MFAASALAVAAVTPGPSRCERVVPGQFHYYTPVTHKLCCSHNSVTASDLTEWFQVQRASVLGVEGDVATVGIELAFRDISHSGVVSWKPLRWYQLGEMHGRRVRASVVSTGLDAAWHVHPVDEDVSADETLLRFQLKLPRRSHSALSVRMLLNFGVRADVRGVEMCVSEETVHVDPGPKTELMVEGLALTELLSLRGPAQPSAPLPTQEQPLQRYNWVKIWLLQLLHHRTLLQLLVQI